MTPADARARLIRALEQPGGESSDFDLDPGLAPGVRPLRLAGVLVGIDLTGPRAEVILTKRSAGLRNHPGQIALPGGRQDSGDADATAAALREAEEEIGLPSDRVTLLGRLPAHETVTGFRVIPVVGLIERPFTFHLAPVEVDEAFRVPLKHLLDPGRYRVEGRIWQGRMRHYPVVPWGPYYIWGATARILRSLAERARS
ncbi:MAG: CoA pyrophosphatase [Rubellimicrobium sp.]|nr:CoA pyrophosphatase [Rubellimicrobium sp.]